MILRALCRRLPALGLIACICPAAAQTTEATLPETIVSGTREPEPRSATPIAATRIDGTTIEEVRPAHPSEILNRVPGVIVTQTSGEGSIVGIRQPFGTAPLNLYLQDNVPVQPTGYFNHNALYLTDIPQAGAVEVIRGPGTSLQGSDAIGGVVNTLTAAPTAERFFQATGEAGSFGWGRGLFTYSDRLGEFGMRADGNITHSGGWRNFTAYQRQSAVLRADHRFDNGTTMRTTLTMGQIWQQTGANSYLSQADYNNNPTRNYTPFAYRHVEAMMLASAWERPLENGVVGITPFFRANSMWLLPSWQLSYDPVRYQQQYTSFGAQLRYRQDYAPWNTRLITGADLDASPGSYREDRLNVRKTGSIYSGYSVGQQNYNFDTTFLEASPFALIETSPIEKLRITGGLRYNALGYQYTNNLAAGAFNAGLGNSSQFYRPASTDRYFNKWSPSLGATYDITPSVEGESLRPANIFADYRQSFRIPQVTQLFREGANTNTVNLQPITAETVEGGLRNAAAGPVQWELVGYRTLKLNDILTQSNNLQPTLTNNGKTLHYGTEFALGFRPVQDLKFGVSGSYAVHRYLSWVTSNGINYSGNTIMSAPRVSGWAGLDWTPTWAPGLLLAAETQLMGRYFMNDANTFTYNGHTLVNLRGEYALNPHVKIYTRLMNVTNTRWATASQVQGTATPQYAPGLPFNAYAGLVVTF
jgi:hypothetical protein